MTEYETPKHKSDDPAESTKTDRAVCSDCGNPVTGTTNPDSVGNPVALYRCENHGLLVTQEVDRVSA